MATTKPTKPSITLPSAFGTSPSNVKTPYTAQELVDGYSASIQQILDGGNVNWLNDTFFKFLTYTTALCDWLNGTPAKKIPFINSSNQLDYIDAPTGNIIGQIISCVCSSSYVPDGCLPCDGSEYTKAQFPDLWTNFLTSNPAKLNVCTYEQYQSDLSSKGFCDKIAVDTTNNKFKVPTLNNTVYQGSGSTFSVKGTGITLGLTNGTDNYGIGSDANAIMKGFPPNYGVAVGSSVGGIAATNKSLGLTTDASKSGIIAENNTKEATSLRYFIVVSNGQINQSQMDWSQWASSLNGKMNTDLSNTSNIAQSFINTVLTWGMPDFTAKIETQNTNYTAPTKGWFYVVTQGAELKVSINGSQLAHGTRSAIYYNVCYSLAYMVNAGDVIEVTGADVARETPLIAFYPCKGVSV